MKKDKTPITLETETPPMKKITIKANNAHKACHELERIAKKLYPHNWLTIQKDDPKKLKFELRGSICTNPKKADTSFFFHITQIDYCLLEISTNQNTEEITKDLLKKYDQRVQCPQIVQPPAK